MSAQPVVQRSGWTSIRLGDVPWHPLILTITIVVTFWLETTVSPFAVFRSLAIAGGIAAALTVALTFVLRDRHIAGAVVLGTVIAIDAQHPIHLVTEAGSRLPGIWMLVMWYALIGLTVLIAGRLAYRAMRRGWNGPGFTRVANLLTGAIFIATLAGGVASGAMGVAFDDVRSAGRMSGAVSVAAGPAAADQPDIFVILLDGYPRADVAVARLGHDNSGFITSLEGFGFEVATESHSDYMFTQLSVPSLLNMAYVEQIPELLAVHQASARLHPTVRQVLNDNPVFSQVRERGYRVVATASGYEHYALRDADVWIDGGQMNEFELQLLASTYAGGLVQLVAPGLASGAHRDRISFALESLPIIAAEPSEPPRFVFAHIPAPHQPSVFRADGEPRNVPLTGDFYSDSSPERGETVEEFTAAYRGQLEHLNGLVLECIRGILDVSDGDAVILVLSDHGTSSRVSWISRNPADSDPADVLERTGTLFAAYTPDRADVFPDDVSPASVFRHLFDAYFGTTYGAALPPENGGYVAPVDASVLSGVHERTP